MLAVIILSCNKNEPDIDVTQSDTVLDEYPDWYAVKAPVDHHIVGVFGSYEKILLISTIFAVFRSTDQGKHWQEVLKQSTGIMGVIQYQDTLFTMSSLVNQSNKDRVEQMLVHADNYSIDDGATWQHYVARNPVLSDIPNEPSDKRFAINPIVAANGTVYKINQVFADGPTATTGIFETPGAITSTGRAVDLPQLHQVQSLYLDDQQRLYLAGSDAVCERGLKGGPFSFCNSKNGRGVVYISKKPLP